MESSNLVGVAGRAVAPHEFIEVAEKMAGITRIAANGGVFPPVLVAVEPARQTHQTSDVGHERRLVPKLCQAGDRHPFADRFVMVKGHLAAPKAARGRLAHVVKQSGKTKSQARRGLGGDCDRVRQNVFVPMNRILFHRERRNLGEHPLEQPGLQGDEESVGRIVDQKDLVEPFAIVSSGRHGVPILRAGRRGDVGVCDPVVRVAGMEPEHACPSPFGPIELHRAHLDRTGTLRAWDGADLLLLGHVQRLNLTAPCRVLIIGDAFGALSLSLAAFSPTVLFDAVSSQSAIVANAKRNGIDPDNLTFVPVTSAQHLVGPFDLIVWNVDRATDVVSHVASLLSSLSNSGSVVLAGGLDKTLPPKTADILRSIGTVTTHPGQRKAHVFEVRVNAGASSFGAIESAALPVVSVPEHGLRLEGAPGVFSADRFDLGARLLAAQIAEHAESLGLDRTVVDLGCGNGVLGLVALRHFPEATVHFLDDSPTAVECARANTKANQPAGLERASFAAADIFGDDWSEPIDVVLCNPPFHHTKAMSDEVAWQMIVQSHRFLAPGGELWIVGNRHLGYHAKLSRVFGNVRQLDAHPKFVVLSATR